MAARVLGRGVDRPGQPADLFTLHAAHPGLYLDRGDGALPLHLDGDDRRDDRRARGLALRGRRLAGARRQGHRRAAACGGRLRPRLRLRLPLGGLGVHAFRLEPRLRACRPPAVDDSRRLAAHRPHLVRFPERAHVGRSDGPRRPRAAQGGSEAPGGRGMSGGLLSPGTAALILFGVFFVLLVLRVPVAFALGLACLPMMLFEERLSMQSLVQETFNAYNSFILLAVPFFLLTANLMNIGGITNRLVRLSRTMVGHFPGALAQINVLLSVFFAGISGSSTADAASPSKIFIDAQVKEGYGLSFSIAITAVSAVLAVIIPPSIPMIVWGGVISTSIGAMYLAGFLPGILIAVAQMVTVHVYAKLRNYPTYERATWRELACASWVSIPALTTQFIIVGGILLGWFTATESACVAVIYSAILSIFFYREMDRSHLYQALLDTGRLASVALFCVGTASAFGWLLAYYQIPKALLSNVVAWGLGPIGVGFFIA